MSNPHGSTFGWPLWGAFLLIIPTAFVIGALTGHTPSWGLLQNPGVLLGSLALAALGNLYSLVHVEVLRGKPSILRIDLTANAFSILVLTISILLGTLLMGYAFVENFTMR
jgi:hypothetical protein